MKYHLAQVNIARFRLPPDNPVNADFVNNLDRVNALAEASEGFVWRMVGDGSDNALDVQAFDDPNMVVNLSVWEDIASLSAFVYRNKTHRSIMRRRSEWFEHMDMYLALWWVPVGHVPTTQEAKARLAHLEQHGPTPYAFTFKQPAAAPEMQEFSAVDG